MRRLIIPVVLLVGVLTLAASGLADPGGKGKGQAQGKNKFTFSLTTTDRRCDGTEPWATLTETRTYQVHANGQDVTHNDSPSRPTSTRHRPGGTNCGAPTFCRL